MTEDWDLEVSSEEYLMDMYPTTDTPMTTRTMEAQWKALESGRAEEQSDEWEGC